MRCVIETSALKIGYSRRQPLHEDLNLQLEEGQLTSLLGLNGAGKSTLLRTICGFLPSIEGKIKILGRALDDYSQRELSTIIGVVLTDRTNTGGITVRELASLGRYPYTGFFGRLNNKDLVVVNDALDATGMLYKANCPVAELSDGERQKVMIAKVLAQQCPVIILDEPTAFLDVSSRIETIALLRRLTSEHGKTVLMSTHDLDTAIRMSDCLWLLRLNKPLLNGAPEDLILSGAFNSFFDNKNIRFDISTGKIAATHSQRSISLEGDSNTTHWIANALIRNGFCPVNYPEHNVECRILCYAPDRITVVFSESKKISVNSVSELVNKLINTLNK